MNLRVLKTKAEKFYDDSNDDSSDESSLRVQSWENQQKASTFLGGCFPVW